MPDIPSVKVVGRFGLTALDGVDSDDEPDVIWCDSGTVTLAPVNTYTKVAGGSPVPWSAGNATMEVPIDSEGYLSLSGARLVRVLDLTSPDVNPSVPSGKATHTVTFRNIKANGTKVEFPSTTVRLAADTVDPITGVCDLTLLTPVPTAGGTPIIVGPRGEQGEPGPEGPQGAPGGSDAATAEWLGSGPLSKAALEARFGSVQLTVTGTSTVTAADVGARLLLVGDSTQALTVTLPTGTYATTVTNHTNHTHTLMRSGASSGVPIASGESITIRA